MAAFIPSTPSARLLRSSSSFTATTSRTALRPRHQKPLLPSPPRRPRPPSTPICDATPTPTPTPDDNPPEVPFEIRGFSLANLGLLLGSAITIYSFSTYFGSNATASATSLGFVYGVPILLIGCALKYAELQPVPVSSSPGAPQARTTAATDIQRKIYSDITRHRYGDEAHLAAALAALGLVPRGEPCPELVEGHEAVGPDGQYRLKLVFYSVATPWKEWQTKVDRYERFFGPGVTAEIEKVDTEKRLVALTLSSVAAGGAAQPLDDAAAGDGKEEAATAGSVEADA